jgi:type I restriction enzyme, S subunit
MAEFYKARMADLCEITSSKRIFAADYVSDGVPFYRGKEITEKYKGNLDVSTELFITEEKFCEIERKFGAPREGDLLLTSVGTLGSPYVVKPCERFYFKDGNLTWFRFFNGLDSKYLYYWLVSPQGKEELQKCTIGSSQSAFTIVLLKGMEIELPPLPAQRYIVSILSAYDELIENNQRRIRILEDMARSLYREWFVHFRYPGHESVPLVDSPLGQIPQGWEVKKLGDILVLNYGKALKKEDRREGEYPVFGSSGIVGTHDTALVNGPGIIVGRKGNVGSIFWCNDNFFVIDTAYFVTSSLPLRFLFYVLPTLNFINSDAAVPGLSRNQAYTLELLVPPADLLAKFCELADTFEQHAATLQRQTANLRRTRDLLLPRLFSGNINLLHEEV